MPNTSRNSIVRVTALALSAALIMGCTSTAPTINTDAAEEDMSFDGLYPVEGGRMDAAWARADFSVEQYSKIMLDGMGVEYRPDGSKAKTLAASSTSNTHYELSPETKVAFEELMASVFEEELAKGEHYEIVTEPGPDVLMVRGGLLDVTSYVPPQMTGRGNVYLSRVGEATLVLELRDSQTGAIFLRAIDRRAAENMSGQFSQSNRATNKSEVSRLARAWAGMLRDGLDRFMAAGDAAGE